MTMFLAKSVALQAVEFNARSWFQNCVSQPDVRDMEAISIIRRRAREGGWGGRITFFGAGEATPQACSLIGRKGEFIGPVEQARGYGASGDGDTSRFDWQETFAQVASTIPNFTPDNHGEILIVSSDTGDIADGGATGGGTECSVQTRSSIGTLGIRACHPTRQAAIPNISNWGPHGYININGASYSVSRENISASTISETTLAIPQITPQITDGVLNVTRDMLGCNLLVPSGTTVILPIVSSAIKGRILVITRLNSDAPILIKSANNNLIATLNPSTNVPRVLLQSTELIWSTVGTIEYPAFRLQPTVPTAFWPTSRISTFQVGQSNAKSRNTVIAHILLADPTRAKIFDIHYTFEHIFQLYGTATEIYGKLHLPPFTGPYPITREQVRDLVPPGTLLFRNAPPPASDKVTNTTNAALATVYTSSPNAKRPAYQPSTVAPFKNANIFWGNRGEGETVEAPFKIAPRGNNTYGAITLPNGDGRPMYQTYDEADAATAATLLRLIGGMWRSDPLYKPQGKPTGILDIAEPYFDVSLWDAYIKASANPSTDPVLTDPLFDSVGPDGTITPGTTIPDLGVLSHFKWAREHPEIFSALTPQGPMCYGRIILPPTRDLAPIRGGDPLLEWIVLDDEADDGRSGYIRLRQQIQLADICHAFGLKYATNSHALDGSARDANGWTQEINWQILEAVDLVLLKFAKQTGDCAASFDRQIDALRGPNFDKPVPASKIGISVNIGNRNNCITVDQCKALNQRVRTYGGTGIKAIQIVAAGAQFRSEWNNPVNLSQAALLGIDPKDLVGYTQ